MKEFRQIALVVSVQTIRKGESTAAALHRS